MSADWSENIIKDHVLCSLFLVYEIIGWQEVFLHCKWVFASVKNRWILM